MKAFAKVVVHVNLVSSILVQRNLAENSPNVFPCMKFIYRQTRLHLSRLCQDACHEKIITGQPKYCLL